MKKLDNSKENVALKVQRRQDAGGGKEKEGPVHLPIGTMLNKRWKITKKIGEGGCGSVYKVEDQVTKMEAACKAESNFVSGGTVLKVEVQVLRRLAGKPHVCQLIHSSKKERFSYMVITLLGESLNILFRRSGKELQVSSQIRVGISVLYGLKQIHDVGFVHRDIKPANLAVGLEGTRAAHFIHILDFGLSREYALKTSDGKMAIRRPRNRCLFRGTTRYCSLHTHDKGEQARVDDLWALLYLMAELRGALPWHNSRDKKEVAEVKRTTPDKVLLYNSPIQLLDFADHLRELNYYSRPNYRKLFDILYEVMLDGGFKYSDPWDWEKPCTLLQRARATLSNEKGASIGGSAEDCRHKVVQSGERLGSVEPSVLVQPSSHDQTIDFAPGSKDALPLPHYGEPSNPFPPEDFDTNPLGL